MPHSVVEFRTHQPLVRVLGFGRFLPFHAARLFRGLLLLAARYAQRRLRADSARPDPLAAFSRIVREAELHREICRRRSKTFPTRDKLLRNLRPTSPRVKNDPPLDPTDRPGVRFLPA